MKFFQGRTGDDGRVPVLGAAGETAAGGRGTAQRAGAFQASLGPAVQRAVTRAAKSSLDVAHTSQNPKPNNLFDSDQTYDRPGDHLLALRQILGGGFTSALRQLPRYTAAYAVASRSLEAGFRRWLHSHSPACLGPSLTESSRPMVRHGLPGGRRRAPAGHHRGRGWPGPGLRGRMHAMDHGAIRSPRDTVTRMGSAYWLSVGIVIRGRHHGREDGDGERHRPARTDG